MDPKFLLFSKLISESRISTKDDVDNAKKEFHDLLLLEYKILIKYMNEKELDQLMIKIINILISPVNEKDHTAYLDQLFAAYNQYNLKLKDKLSQSDYDQYVNEFHHLY